MTGPPSNGAEMGVEGLLGDLARWTAEARAADVASSRSRQQWLRRQAAEEATLAGIALDLAEQSAVVVVRTVAGRAHRGRLVGVTRELAVLRSESGTTTTVIPWAAVAWLRPRLHRRPEEAGPRSIPLDLGLLDVLAAVAGSQPRVVLGFSQDQETLSGEMVSVGGDVIGLRIDADAPTTIYVRLASLTEVSLLGSG